MMPWVGLLKSFLGLASMVAEHIKNKNLMEAGEAKAILEGLQNAKSAIQKAKDARANARASFDGNGGMLQEDDPNLRD